MRDRTEEAAYYGRIPLPLDGLDRVVCLAPHPDDEVLGCGGLLSILAMHGRDVRTIVLTDGQVQSGQAPSQRRQESTMAAACLGLATPLFWGLEDRGLSYGEALVNRILDSLRGDPPTHLLLPSLSEPHPDHQSVALAGLAAAHALGCHLLFYEAAAPLVPSHLVDISEVVARKSSAMACFASQEEFQDYRLQSSALGQLRAHGYPGGAQAVEAYFLLSHDELLRSGPAAARCDALSVRERLGLANAPSDLPLVSVILRSTGRPSLRQSLDCVAAQTHCLIETVVVDALGLKLGRSEAANRGLERARGGFALFLDDDDLIEPQHVSKLLSRLLERPQSVAAYSGVRLVNAEGEQIGVYDEPWSLDRLTGANFIPIHAVLFRLPVVREHRLQFDPSLPVLEDWAFWLDLAALGPFEHCPGVSATYRRLDRGSGLSDINSETHWETWQLKILEKRLAQQPTHLLAKTLAWNGRELAAAVHRLWEREREVRRLNQEHSTAMADLLAANERLAQGYEQQLRELMASREGLAQGYEQQLRELMASREGLAQGYEQQLRELMASREGLAQGYEQQLRALLQHQQGLSASLAREQGRLTAVLGSRLWRWTKPMRALLDSISGRGAD